MTTAVAVEVGRRFEALRASTPGFGNGTSGGPWFRSFSVRNGTGTLDGVTGGYQDGGSNASPSYADNFSWYFSDLIAAASKRITHCNSTGTAVTGRDGQRSGVPGPAAAFSICA